MLKQTQFCLKTNISHVAIISEIHLCNVVSNNATEFSYLIFCLFVAIIYIITHMLSTVVNSINPKTFLKLNITYLRIYAGARCFKVSQNDISLTLI